MPSTTKTAVGGRIHSHSWIIFALLDVTQYLNMSCSRVLGLLQCPVFLFACTTLVLALTLKLVKRCFLEALSFPLNLFASNPIPQEILSLSISVNCPYSSAGWIVLWLVLDWSCQLDDLQEDGPLAQHVSWFPQIGWILHNPVPVEPG